MWMQRGQHVKQKPIISAAWKKTGSNKRRHGSALQKRLVLHGLRRKTRPSARQKQDV